MSVGPVAVNRDENGMWVHPSLPVWNEGKAEKEVHLWLAENNLDYHLCYFQDDVSEERAEKWFVDGNLDCSDWHPECKEEGAFLLSIHDSNDGPVAFFAFPCSQKKKSQREFPCWGLAVKE
tara:strand:- start:67 stop:429 length:363 start_codon:yes stop_codon:yes gene_type:complete